DDRRGGTVPIHPARRVDALQLRHRPDQSDQTRKPATLDSRVPRGNPRDFPASGRTRISLRRRHDAARGARPQCVDVQELSALHLQPTLPADRSRSAVPERGKPVPVDERDDRPEEGTQLLRDAGYRISDRWRAVLGITQRVAYVFDGVAAGCAAASLVRSMTA